MSKKEFKESAIYLYKLTKEFIKELFEPKVSFYAASMSWATIFFVIPLLVIILSIIVYTPIFTQYYDKIHTIIANSLVPGSSKVIMQWIDKFIANASSMGIIGVAYITVASIMFFRDFDYIVNDIFDNERRSFKDAIITYFLILIIIPISLGGTIWIYTKVGKELHITPYIMQFILTWATIFILYKVSPKEKIPTKIVAISSFVATFVWYIAKSIFILYLYYNKTYTTIYGGVSIALFFFLWIYISWVIFLHGLQLSSVLYNEDKE